MKETILTPRFDSFHCNFRQATRINDPNGVVSLDRDNNVFQVDAVMVQRRAKTSKEEVKPILDNNSNQTHGTAKHLTGIFEKEESFELEDILKATDKPIRQRPKQKDDGRYVISKAASDLEKMIGGPEIKPSGTFSTFVRN